MQSDQIMGSAGAVAAAAFGLGVYSRWGFSALLLESLNGLQEKIPQGLYAELKANYRCLRNATWNQDGTGHIAEIVDELISLSDCAAKGFGDLKPFYYFGVLLGDIVAEGNKLTFRDGDNNTVMKLLRDLPKKIRLEPPPSYLRNYLRLVSLLSGFVKSDNRFYELWKRVPPDLKLDSPQKFIETVIENLHLRTRWVQIPVPNSIPDDPPLKLWAYHAYKTPEMTMPKLMAEMAKVCKEKNWDEVTAGTIRKWIKQLESEGWPAIKKRRGRPSRSARKSTK